MSLHDAVKHDDLSAVEALLEDGAEVDERQGRVGRTPLHIAAQKNHVEIAGFLISQGAAVSATTTWSLMTPLHYAADKDSVDVAMLLVEEGAEVDAQDREGRTPLHCAAIADSNEVAAYLLRNGSSHRMTDQNGQTPLHLVARNNLMEVAELLLSHGASVGAVNTLGRTPLHEAASYCRPKLARLLLQHGARINRVDSEGNSPLRCLVVKSIGDDRVWEDEVKMAYRLMAAGARWTSKDEQLVRRVARENQREEQVSGILAAIYAWNKQRKRGVRKLTRLPVEVYKRGEVDIRVYFKSMKQVSSVLLESMNAARLNVLTETHEVDAAPEEEEHVYRKKLCVVGPTQWGKTSFIKTLTTNEPTLEELDDRTIGIDIFAWEFEAPSSDTGEKSKYKVSIWDFAGQDEYQSTHTLFYSKRTMYLVCIDLNAYAEALEEAGIEEAGARSSEMDGFVEKNIFRWIRVISAREPESEFLFIGTKADLIEHDEELVEKITTDVMMRIARKEDQAVQELQRTIDALHKSRNNDMEFAAEDAKVEKRILNLETISMKRPRYLSKQLVLTTSADLTGQERVHEQLEQHIVESDTSFLMPDMYQQVEDFIRNQVQIDESETPDAATLVRKAFRNANELFELIESELEFSGEEIRAILHVLHGLGDILWFDDSEEELADIVFLNPSLVIDFIRQVINHKLGSYEIPVAPHLYPLHEAVRNEGRVSHELLSELEMWYEIQDDQLMLQLKQLLFQFQLAYPAGKGLMEWNSDLIVPIYWKKRALSEEEDDQSELPDDEELTERVCWEYDFHRHLPENIFEMLGVQSYSSHYSSDRLFTWGAFETRMSGKYVARIAKKQRDGSPPSSELDEWSILSIEVNASSNELAWQQLVWYSMNLERLLEDRPGLWVTRYTVSSGGKRFDVEQLLTEMVEMHEWQVEENLLPPRMEWFTKKAWTNRAEVPNATPIRRTASSDLETDMEARFRALLENQFHDIYAHIDVSTDKLLKQLAEIGNRRDYPALWTLELHEGSKYFGLASTYILRIRSQLSGRCFHDPIEITVPGTFFAKYGIFIKLGVSVFASVAFGEAAAPIVEHIGTELQTATELHNMVEGMEFLSIGSVNMENDRTLSPDGTIVLLRELLTAYDRNFDPLKMSTVSGLECGILIGTGEHVWAHRSEILLRDDIVLRHDYRRTSFGSNSMSSDEPVEFAEPAEVSEPVIIYEKVEDSPEDEPTVICDGTTISLRIMGVENLLNIRHIGKQSPYCKWKLVSPNGRVIASSRTLHDVGGGTDPSWKGQTFLFDLPDGIASLENTILVFRVKTTRGWRLSDEIAMGSVTIRDVEGMGLATGDWQENTITLLHKKGELAGRLRFYLRLEALGD
ncbi:hypothetical protein Poli38472_010185 [Pythium oligandrum]|uniref:non-specific serine/threonine protein kinase n=1 Tax=Pythium oligandrum TaxID=41045 RepID=A0A8K1C8H5_PYTOL|nr:hypothetical protein Poli38472_010185 [Pythium oligandrum]|eukprot:TMW58626.1 hypothetical protein Poli38472_010185 [Pythium oligandrum]